MNVILLEPVDALGEAGVVVTVKNGYARNWLIPQGLALPATKSNTAELQARLAQRARQLAERKSDAERLAEILAETSIEITVRAGEGRIYGSVGNKDIADALKAQHDVDIDRRKIVLSEPIKVTGEHVVPYKPHPEVTIDLKVNVVPENA